MTASPLAPDVFRISLLTLSGAETVARWFTPIVQEWGGSVELAAWPPEVYITLPQGAAHEELLAGWQYDLVAERNGAACLPNQSRS